jgi:predicted TIM-barrel fold metal-dependent hydrolase
MADGEPIPIVDAHQHFWDLERNYYPWLCDRDLHAFRYGDYSAIRQTYLPPDYRRDSSGFDVVKTVHIEAEFDPEKPVAETLWVEGLAAEHGLPSAIVAQARLARDDVDEVLAAQGARPLVRGIRYKPAAAASPGEARRGAPGSMDDPAWRRGHGLLARHGLSFDLLTPWWHLDAAADLARDFPATQIIINHAGLPADRSTAGLAGWRRGLETAAACGNIALKISGLGRPGLPWTLEANGPIIRDCLAIFGSRRCMFASNYPVDRLAGAFKDIYSGFQAATASLPLADRQALFHDNAVRLYRL